MMSIKLSEVLEIKVYSFSQKSEGETIYFSRTSNRIVSYGGSTYSSAYNGPPYDGQIVFTTLEEMKPYQVLLVLKASGCRILQCLQIFGLQREFLKISSY